ncbi:MAG: SIS domain-containing protein [Candidatus Aenigmarchaeota archaeon]|nr:SIS domain-containing protein [Candidatus Aenigmarchaeota archaeon]
MNGFVDNYFSELKKIFDKMNSKNIEEITDVIYKAYENQRNIFILGNGGSASTASHFACDLGKGTLSRVYDKNEKRFRVISLTDNAATISAYANDLSFDDIFVQQLRNLVHRGDIVIAITGSGNSKNVLKAMEYAKDAGAVTVGMLGFDGGKVKQFLDKYVIVPSNHYGRVEDLHIILEHLITDYLRNKIKESK